MVIEYLTLTTEENVMQHRYFNTIRFGDNCDETFAGPHLGENFIEFSKNTINDEWEYIDGLIDPCLWMFGEDAQSCNWNHTQNDSTDTTDTRYSIIFDLQGRT